MAHIDNPQTLRDWYAYHNSEGQSIKPYWTIYNSEREAQAMAGSCWCESSQIPAFSEEVGKRELDRAIGMMTHGNKYFIKLSDVPEGKSKASARTDYTHIDPSKSMVGIGGIPDHTKMKEELRAELRKEFERDAEIQKLKDDYEELKKSKQDPWFDRIGSLLNHDVVKANLPIIIGKIFNPEMKVQSTQISGNNGEDLKKEADNMTQSVNDWLDADEDALKIIQKLSKLAKSNPTKYYQLKPFVDQI